MYATERSRITKDKKIVVIVGAGFAGLNAAKSFANDPAFHVLLIDQRNYHLFQPLLYQVATAGLNPSDIAVPIRTQFTDVENVHVHMGRVDKIDLNRNILLSYDKNIEEEYDYLILACGVQHSYFGNKAWEEFAPGLKTIEQASEIRRRILTAFEDAENELDIENRKKLMTFVVVGGGPTGVELAGAIADISKKVFVQDFKRIDPSEARIILIEAGQYLLSSFSTKLSQTTSKSLESLGVQVLTSTKVLNITKDGVQVENEFISAATILWAAGVESTGMSIDPSVNKDRAGRIKVEADLSILNFPNAFVIGDMASCEITTNRFVPGVAPAAIQMGKHVAKVVKASEKNLPRPKFNYKDKGQMATIGRYRAVMQIKNIKASGIIAWLSWVFIHIFYIVGFKNKISVFIHWVWSYIFSKRGSRLITNNEWKSN